jgi:SAM-dependent methyltransferase
VDTTTKGSEPGGSEPGGSEPGGSEPGGSELEYESLEDPGVIERHQRLAALLELTPADRVVVDLGCGDGATLGNLLTHLDHDERDGIVIGVDAAAEALAAAAARFSSDRHAGRLSLVRADLDASLPLASETVDKALCHNVLECLPDPDRVLLEAYRVLRPGGRLILSHPDYDTMVFTAPDLALTRRLVHAYCDTQQDWMDAVNGTIGRWLHDIAARSPFTVGPVNATVMLSRGWRPRLLGYQFAQHIATVLRRTGVVPPEDLDGWLASLAEVDERGEFLWTVVDFAVVCHKDAVT